MAKQQEIPQLDFSTDGTAEQFIGLFRGFIADVTDPQLIEIGQQVLVDTAQVAALKVQGAEQELIDEASASLTARGKTIVGIPGLIAANKQEAFWTMFNRATGTLINFGVNILMAYAGLPPVPKVAVNNGGEGDGGSGSGA